MLCVAFCLFKTIHNLHYEQIGKEVRCIEDELPFEIPSSWEWIHINDISDSYLGKTLNRIKDTGKPVPYLCSINIQNSSIVLDKIKTALFSDEEITKYKLKKNDLLICEGGDVGRAAIWKLEDDMYFQNALHRVRFINEINPNYFLYVLKYYKDMKIIERVSKGVTIKHFVQGSLFSLYFPLPSISEQNRIINKIMELEPLIEKYKQLEEQLYVLNSNIKEQLKKSIIQYAIEGKLVPQDSNDEPASVLLERIRKEKEKLIAEGKIKKDKNESVIYRRDNSYYEKLGNRIKCINEEVDTDLPNSWIYLRLGEACNIINGFTPLRTKQEYWSNPTIPWFTVDDIHSQGRRIYKTKQSINSCALGNSSNRILPADTVLLCCTASVGEYAIAKISLTTNQQFNGLAIKPEYKSFINSNYLFILASSFKNVLIKMAGKTTFSFISVKKLSSILIPVPPLKEQMYIADLIEKTNYTLEK